MFRRLPLALPLLLGVLGGCTLGGATTEPAATGIEGLVDLPVAEGVVWQREIAGEELLGVTPSADAAELSLIAAALDQVPQPIKDKAEVRHLVRSTDAIALDPATLAFSRGPDIHLIDKTFEETSRLDLAYTLAHELAHVAQFNTFDPDLVDQAAQVASLDPNLASLDVLDFVAAIGWLDQGAQGWFSESAGTGTTLYGASSPAEDMAEAVALVAMGRADELSQDRIEWVERWADVSAIDMARGKPWRPPGAGVIRSEDPIYDEQAVAALGAAHVEPIYLLLADDGSTTQQLADSIGTELRARGMAGVLTQIDDPLVPRIGGQMVRPGGSQLWVELWDFREATGFTDPPPGAVLTYVDVWS